MRTFSYFLFLFIFIAFSSCSKKDDVVTDPDFTVLGITSVNINGKQFSVSNSLLNLDSSDNIALTGIQTTKSIKKTLIEYVVFTTSQEAFSVNVVCCYSDVSIIVNTKTSDSLTESVVQVTRNGFEEQLTYKFIQKSL